MNAKRKVRLWVVGPCLLYLAVFFLWFPRWQHAPQSHSARLLGGLFLAMTAAWVIPVMVGTFWYGDFLHFGLRDVVALVRELYETFLKKDAGSTPNICNKPTIAPNLAINRPALVITKRLKNGTTVRGACPLCDVEFSTEAFETDRTYPHEQKLDEWYEEHFQDHIAGRAGGPS